MNRSGTSNVSVKKATLFVPDKADRRTRGLQVTDAIAGEEQLQLYQISSDYTSRN